MLVSGIEAEILRRLFCGDYSEKARQDAQKINIQTRLHKTNPS